MGGWENRAPAEIQMGNGTLLVTLDSVGEIEQVFAPHIDALQARLGSFRNSILLPNKEGEGHPTPGLIHLSLENFHIRLKLLTGSQVLQSEYHHRTLPIRVTRRLGLHPMEPILLDQWTFLDAPCGILNESLPWMGNTTSSQCSLYHPSFNGLVHHRGRRWFGVMMLGQAEWVRVGHLSEHDRYQLWAGEKVYAPIGAGDLAGYPSGSVPVGWDHVVQGPATWGAIATEPANEVRFAVICAESEKHLGQLLELVKNIPNDRYFEMIDSMVVRRHAPAHSILNEIKNPKVRAVCERSIDVLHALQDGRTGALMAAAEVDPHSRLSGGYGFSWPRDGAYLASALGAFGFRERVEHYFKFLTDTQDESGAWWQRYLATGHAGPSWGRIQIDEPATVIGAAMLHYLRTEDLFWLERIWPTVQKGLSFLEEFHSSEHPLGMPSHDLWEERMGIHAYSLAAVASAFLSGAYMAKELSDRASRKRYMEWARSIAGILHERFIPPSGPVRRSFVVNAWDYARGGGYWDEVPDVSLLGLIVPFHVISKRDPVASRILDEIRTRLWCKPTGGVLRYEGDVYRGGNPWVLTTLWLGMMELALGHVSEARECFQWVMSKATPLDMFAEQVHKESGRPFWVIPLAWSHAMYLLFVKQVLKQKLEGKIWESI